jgi:hypothetical protein
MNLRVLFFFAFLSASMLPAQQSFRFLSPQPGCVMRVLKSANASVSVLTNGGDAPVKCQTQHPDGLHGQTLWGDLPADSGTAAIYSLPPRGTAVTLWQ